MAANPSEYPEVRPEQRIEGCAEMEQIDDDPLEAGPIETKADD